jgi:hypothetical protein
MHINDQYRSFVRQYIEQGKALNVGLMDRLYDFDAHGAFNFLKTIGVHAPNNLRDYPSHLKKIAELYFSMK